MKLEKLKKKNYQKIAVGGLITLSILSVLIYKTTSAKYRTTQSINIAKGTIKYSPADFKVLAMYQENSSGGYTAINKMPSSGYVINESKSYCMIDGTNKDTTAKLYTNSSGEHVMYNLSKNDKCYLYFDNAITNFNELLASYQSSGKISTARSGAITTSTEMDNGKLYSVADDYGTSYVYAGTNPNNYVQFGGFWWRIIRINGDGSVRLIYNGIVDTNALTAIPTGVGTQIKTRYSSNTTAQQYNASEDHNAHVGYMYGSTETTGSTYTNTHTNTTSSSIKTEADNWYKTNLNKTGVKEKIDYNGTFCNDRKVDKTALSIYQGDGSGTTKSSYAPFGRLYTNGYYKTSPTPSLKCSQSNDLFTATSATRGNKKLTYPVGLITSDEVVLAGGFADTNRTFWLNTGVDYWTMSPVYYHGSSAILFAVDWYGNLYVFKAGSAFGVRPVINLKANTTFVAGGTGTANNPYVVV